MLASVAATAAAVAITGQGQALAQPFPPAPPSVLKQAEIDVGSAVALPDVIYSRLPGFRPLKLDLYKPKAAGKPRPLVLWFHGGGWAGGDPRGGPFSGTDGPALFGEIAGRGYVVASISYRFVNEAKFPAQVQDARAALRFLRAHAAEYGIDPTQVIAMGGSAGAYLSSMLGASCGDASFDPRPAPGPGGAAAAPPPAGSECVQAVVDFYPVSDMVSLSKFANPSGAPYSSAQGILGAFLGCAPAACPPEELHQASIIERINAKTPPFLIMHGADDVTVPVQASRDFDAALKAKGVSSELIVVPGTTHTFPQITPEARRQLIDRFERFLDDHTRR